MKPSELLSDETKWTQVAYGRIAIDGDACDAESPSAVCWCAMGALRKCYAPWTTEKQLASIAIYDVLTSRGIDKSLPGWNDADSRTFTEVRELLLAAGL